MIIFANPCSGKTTANFLLDLGGHEINNRKYFLKLREGETGWKNTYIERLCELSSKTLLFSRCLDYDDMQTLLGLLPPKQAIICGWNAEYSSTLLESIKRRNSDPTKGYTSVDWASACTIEDSYREFSKLRKAFPGQYFIELMPNKFLSDAIRDIPEVYNNTRYDYEKLRQDYPDIF